MRNSQKNILKSIFNQQKLNKIPIMNFCSFLSNDAKPGQYALQAFKKVPQLSVLTQAWDMFNRSNQQQGRNNMSNMNNNNMAGNNSYGYNNTGGGSPPTTYNISGILSQFINNVPIDSMKASDSNLDQIIQENQDAVIKKILKSDYAQLIKKYNDKNKNNEKFTDPDFPPEQSSVGNVDDIKVRATWKRIPQIIKGPEFVSSKIEPSDILQGSLGDCYFLSAISALAENDFRIRNLFPNLKMNQHGIYMARILYQGVLREVVVDDYVPVNAQGAPMFAKPAGGREIWVMILEKCWAKLHGSYGAIVGGLPNQVLHAFSGAPTFYRPVSQNKQKRENLWKEMFQAHQNEGILCCGTKGQASVEKAGLVLGHAYSIIDVFENPYRLLKLRNPWGKREWNGRASDEDSQFWSSLSPQDRQRLKYTRQKDGTFFMLWDDFVNYFDMVDICKIKDNSNFLSIDAEFDKKNGEMFQFQIPKKASSVTISLSQKSLRGFGEAIQRQGYARSSMVVARYQQNSKGHQYKYIDSSSSKLFSEHPLELQALLAGKYVVFAKYDWIRDNPDQATFSLYTQASTTVKKIKQTAHKQFLFKTFLDHARRNPKKQVLSEQPKEWICSDFLLNKGGYGYLVIHLNENSTRKIGVQLNEKEYTEKRLTLKKPYKGQGTIKTMVEPGKELIIPFRMKAHNYPASITLPTPKIYNLM